MSKVRYEFVVELSGRHGALTGELYATVESGEPSIELEDARDACNKLAVKILDLLGETPSTGFKLTPLRKIIDLRE